MRSSVQFASAAALLLAAQTALAAPFEMPVITFTGNVFKVSQLSNEAFVASGVVALVKAFQKFGAAVPDQLVSAVQTVLSAPEPDDSDSGTVQATPTSLDAEYLCSVQIGTPPQTLMLDFDTGSSDLWVFSSQTELNETNGQTSYQPGQSTTAELLADATWGITYGDGSSSSGDVFYDVVSIGSVTVTEQAVEAAEKVSSMFTSNALSDGLLGLAFSNLNTVAPKKQLTFFDNAIETLASPLFTANLQKGAAGNYNFGYIDHSEYTGHIGYAPLANANGFWEITSSGYGVGDNAFNSTDFAAIADTGTTLLLIPDAICEDYYSYVDGAVYNTAEQGYVFPCKSTLPDFTFGAGSYHGTIPGDFMNFQTLGAFATGGEDYCYGGIQANTGLPFAIFGDILLKSQFVVFDAGNKRVGFAAKPL